MDKKDLLSRTRKNLLEIAAHLRIAGRSKMKKSDLIAAIRRAVSAGAGRSEVLMPGKESRRRRRRTVPLREATLIRRSWREQQAMVQHAKYESKIRKDARAARPSVESAELPRSYGEDKIVLLVRDPYWIHVYWDISRETLLRAKAALGEEWFDARSVLRVYDVTGIDFDGRNANASFDVQITSGASNWYVNTGIPNRTYCIDVGLVSKTGEFTLFTRSNKVTTPRDAPSGAVDEEWVIPDWEFERIRALSDGLRPGVSSFEFKGMMDKPLGGKA